MGHPIIDCDVHVYPRDPEELQKYLPLPWKHWYRGESRPFYQDKPPLHYLHRNVRLTTQPMENPDDPAHLAALLRSIEADKVLMYSSDYPHFGFDAPTVIARHLPAEMHRRVFHANAARLYGLPLAEPATATDRASD